MSEVSLNKSKINSKELKRREFILNGNLFHVIFVIFFPLFLFSIFNYIYSIIDTIMCSGISKEAVNAVGALNQVNNMVTALGGGLSAGGSILIAREIGKKNYDKAKTLSNTTFFYAFVIAVLTSVIFIPLRVPLLRLMNVSEESIAVGQKYFIFSLLTSSVLMINNVYMGVEKARGSTLFITLLNMGVVILKIALNALFLYGFKIKQMEFVSLCTFLANSTLTIFIICRLLYKNYIFHFSIKQVDFSFKNLKRTFKIAFPIFLGKFIFSLGKVSINALAKDYGSDVVGALGVSNNMGGSVTNPISSIEDSTSSIISQNIGAKNIKRAQKTFFVGLVFSLSIAIIGVLIVSIFNDQICNFFARSVEDSVEREEYAKHISEVFYYEKMGIITLALNSSVLGLLYGFGYTKVSSILNISRVFVYRIPSFLVCKYLIKMENGYSVCGISMGFSNIAIGITSLTVALIILYHIYNKMKIKERYTMLTKEELKQVDDYILNFLKNYQPYKNGQFCYEDGVVLNGAYQLYKVTKKNEYLDFVNNYYDTWISQYGTLTKYNPQNHNLDDLEAGYTLFKINEKEHKQKYEKALMTLRLQYDLQPRSENTSFFHKERYPYQLWLDGVYMAQPLYALFAFKEHSNQIKKDIVTQFENAEKYTFDPELKLYMHAYDEKKERKWANKETGRSSHCWLRSVGWLIMADCDCYEIFKNNTNFIPKIFKEQLNNVLNSIQPYQDSESKMFYDVVNDKDQRNYLETSGSLMVSYGYLKGSRIGMLPYENRKEGSEIFEGIVRKYLKDGHLNNICLVSGLDDERRDGSLDYYYSEPIVSDDSKGVGPFMMAYSEYLEIPCK